MKNPKLLATIGVAALMSATTVNAQDFTRGTVKEIKADEEKVTIIHEELTNLDMPAMTMVFEVADPAMLDQMAEGSDIEFVAERVQGKITVTQLR